MAAFNEDVDRKIIPRWREFRVTSALQELSPLKSAGREIDDPKHDFEERLYAWQTNRTFSFAADLLSSAILFGRAAEVADAAEFVLLDKRVEFSAAKSLARIVLKRPEDATLEPRAGNDLERWFLNERVALLRQDLRSDPRNAFAWVDLARLQETLGEMEKANRSMQSALYLAPNERFVLRSASRFFIHHGNLERAHSLLSNSDSLRHDPWLLAAEIATAGVAGRSSKNIKLARRILEAKSVYPLHLSELASALGTLELESGNLKRARKLLEASLTHPSENSIAQAAWAVRKDPQLNIDKFHFRLGPTSFEALAWETYIGGKWLESMQNSIKWLADQPFSGRPAVFGSYIAAVGLGDYTGSIKLIDQGLQANPDDFSLINNKAFALAHLGKPLDAQRLINQLSPSTLSTSDTIVLLATRGLISFRSGNPDAGRALYRQAIESATAVGDARRGTLAYMFYVYEELCSGNTEALAMRDQIAKTAQEMKDPAIIPIANRIRDFDPRQLSRGDKTRPFLPQ